MKHEVRHGWRIGDIVLRPPLQYGTVVASAGEPVIDTIVGRSRFYYLLETTGDTEWSAGWFEEPDDPFAAWVELQRRKAGVSK